jgi:predicted CoA-binding protein
VNAAAAWVESDEALRAILKNAKTIALVGASPKPWRDSNAIMSVLLGIGFDVVPVNPNYAEVLGRPCVPGLRAVGRPIDIVNVFRRPSALGELVAEALAVGAKCLWLQPGAVDEGAARTAAAAGMLVVADRCIAVDSRRLL